MMKGVESKDETADEAAERRGREEHAKDAEEFKIQIEIRLNPLPGKRRQLLFEE
ncbi:MAG: hypothetical protein J0I00_05935 [Burkholderiales bacterium]|uniref:Uncharacterized protein n=1 Tax=Ottowia pentelensis TaxID=511108 RepID=A0ABV6PXW8_9BURK|nr:hypothetical protein [Burkholderiales bacterium]MBS0403643.1 hypothetical protein [Pseudomonadota bacterium]MBS0414930.1 hypothetical protein [Pseudomonadota bacterium]